MDQEKQALLSSNQEEVIVPGNSSTTTTNRSKYKVLKALSICLFLFIISDLSFHSCRYFFSPPSPSTTTVSSSCQQYPPQSPPLNFLLDANKDLIYSPEYRLKSVAIHSGLVQIHSESFDDLGPISQDSRWEVFYSLSSYLRDTFKLLHSNLELTKVNTHGLLYEWVGSDSSLKPILLAAHQDTVPVNLATLDLWTHSPWSGHYDGIYVWGRGSSDCKNTLAGIFEAITLLLEGGFKPKRTILLAFGFDEESKGYEGAGELAKVLKEKYGQEGIAFILDEGGLGIGEMFGKGFALPATGEKGYLDVNFTLHTPGGHSSIPPPHTGIGMLSHIITSLESSPSLPSISLSSPIYSLLQCAATHGNLSSDFKKVIEQGGKGGKKGEKGREEVARRFAEMGRAQRYLVSTSQAVDVIGGGVKVNALPELSYFVANYRISVDSNSAILREKIKKLVLPIVKRYELDLEIFNEKIPFESLAFQSQSSIEEGQTGSGGQLTISGINQLEPAPISSTFTPQWKILSSTIQHVYSERFVEKGTSSSSSGGLIVSPCVMTGNTDTRFYWDLSKNIYRFTPMDRSASFGIHTVDEHLLFDDHISGIWFFHELIRNADEASFE